MSGLVLPFARDPDRKMTPLEQLRELEYAERDIKEVAEIDQRQIDKISSRLSELAGMFKDATLDMETRERAYNEADALKASLEDLFIRQRLHKILMNVWQTVYAKDGDGTQGMLDCERDFFTTVLVAAKEYQKAVMG